MNEIEQIYVCRGTLAATPL